MAYYAYKAVRDLLPAHIVKEMGEDYEGDGNYDGDQWYAAEAYILELQAHREELKQALIGLDEAYCRAGTNLNAAERTEDRLRLVTARAVLAKAATE